MLAPSDEVHKVKATALIREFRSGSSLPILVRTDSSEKYVVKWHQTAEGTLECLSDWVCLHIADYAAIAVPKRTLITIPLEFSSGIVDSELREIATRSAGLNLGVEFLENTLPFDQKEKDLFNFDLRRRIFLLDLLLLNIDRTIQNPNMLVRETNLFCIDFSASAVIRESFSGSRLSLENCLRILRRHPFFESEVEHFHIDGLEQIVDRLENTILRIPEYWCPDPTNPDLFKKLLLSNLLSIFNNAEELLSTRFEILRSMPEETSECIRENNRRKKLAFLEKHNLLRR